MAWLKSNPLKYGLLSSLGMLLFILIYSYHTLQGSLPRLEGVLKFERLKSEVTIKRDQQGIPTIKASTRSDTAFALGFLHGQERFFQMDLLRRNSAGELSELFGVPAKNHDKGIRIHQFRKRGQAAIGALSARQLKVIEAYRDGVNAALIDLHTKPFEYFLLGVEPSPWATEDSLLTLYSMYLDLQPQWSESERSLAIMKQQLPTDWFDFLTSQGGYWDAPIHGAAFKEHSVIPASALASFGDMNNTAAGANASVFQDQIQYGSNNWSVAGNLTQHGGAMLANDMHLGLRVPNIWYRASWYLEDGRRVTGASLPGTPAMVVGSNEHIAWGFTNSQGDYHDVIVLKTNHDQSQYLTPTGMVNFVIENETLNIKDEARETVEVKLTQWGPVIGKNPQGQLLAMRWVAHDVQGANLNLMKMEDANNVADALLISPTAGIPGQNLNVVDKDGNIAWSIMGRLPNRFGFSVGLGGSQLPQDWSAGDKGWSGYLTASQYPKVVNPEHGRIWTANARIVSDELLQKVGINNYALGPRQKQIRDGLFKKEAFTEQDFLDIQLDDNALFLSRWQQFMLTLLKEVNEPVLLEAKTLLQNWQGRASKTSVGYLLVKRFRERVVDQTIGHIYRHLEKNSNEFWPSSINNFVEYPVWQLINEQPVQHVPAGFKNWPSFLSAQVSITLLSVTKDGKPLQQQTWGKYNTLDIKHPLSRALPMLGWFLDMKAVPMDGDTYMPRVQDPDTGASQRLAVAPGHEDEGVFHMATGQSAHPLSPFFHAGHTDWVEGKPSAFLPGSEVWRLTLKP
jgi:penicillin amidase